MNLSNPLLQQKNIIDHVTPSLSDNHLLMFCSDDLRVKYSARSHLDSMLHLHEKVVSRGPDRNSVLNTRLRRTAVGETSFKTQKFSDFENPRREPRHT